MRTVYFSRRRLAPRCLSESFGRPSVGLYTHSGRLAVALTLALGLFSLVQPDAVFAAPPHADVLPPRLLDSSAQAAPTKAPLSLSEAEQLAVQNDQGLAAAQALESADSSTAKAADQLPDPDISVGLSSLPLDTFSFTQTPMTTTEFRISQTLPPGDTLAQRALAADARIAAATANVSVQQHILRREVGRFWLTVYRDQQTVVLLEQEKTLYRRLLRSAQTAYSAGRARATDLVRLQVRLAQLDDRIDKQQASISSVKARLARWIGGRAQHAWPHQLPSSLIDLPSVAAPQDSIAEQPEIKALQAKLAEARAQTGEARAAFKPKFGVSLGYGVKAGNQPDTLSVGVTMSLPIFSSSRQQPLLVAAQRREQAQQLELDNRAADLQAQAQALIAEIKSLNRRIKRYDLHILPKLKQVATLAQNQFGAGGGDFTAIIDAEQAEVAGHQQQLDLMIDRASRLIDLRYILENHA